MSLPTIESSYVSHTSKGIQGFQHPDYAALRIASEVLNATESYLWVCHSFCSTRIRVDHSAEIHPWLRFGVWGIRVDRHGGGIPQFLTLQGRFRSSLVDFY